MPADDPRSNQIGHGIDVESDRISQTGETATRLIRELAERQHGVVARRQLLELGLGRGLIQERRRSGGLMLVHRGVYAVGHRRHDIHHRWMAAVLACGAGAVLSNRSAAQLWALRGFRGPVEVTRRSGGTVRAGIRVRQALLPGREVTREAGIPVTTLERTLLDLAGMLDERQLGRALAAAERSGRLEWSALRATIEAGSGHAGVERLRVVAATADPRAIDARSGLEIDFLGLCRDAHLPLPSVNVLAAGKTVDFLWTEQRVVVEIDSYHYHSGQISFEADHDSTLVLEEAGYRVIRATERMLRTNPARVLQQVRRALDEASDST